MASKDKVAQQFARQLFAMSMVDGSVSTERVGGVLAFVEKNPPHNPILVLKAYQRLISTEVAKSVALVEHAGAVGDDTLASIASAMSKKYGRTVTATAKPNPALLAGLRVHVGDDIYESSISGQLAALAASV
jgi:F-type H+-transporting ATPase subunit delta